jgi:hypothetical protein
MPNYDDKWHVEPYPCNDCPLDEGNGGDGMGLFGGPCTSHCLKFEQWR